MAGNADEFIPTRRTLLSRLKNWDDADSWRSFFETYWRLIYGVALKAGLSEAEAEEVLQETVISVAKTMPGFKYDPQTCSFKSWLLHLTRKRIADQFRKRPPESPSSKRKEEETAKTSTLERVPDPMSSKLELVWDEEWEKNLLQAALEKIKRRANPKQYQMFYLHVVKKQPVAEVAASLGVSLGQVYMAKHRIARQVKKEIRNLETKIL